MKQGIARNIVVGCILLLFVLVVAIQSTGILEQHQTALVRDDQSQANDNGNSPETKEEQAKKTNLADSTIIPFIEKLTHRYPILRRLGENMGLNKYSASSMIQQCGNDNIIKVYILIFTKMLNL